MGCIIIRAIGIIVLFCTIIFMGNMKMDREELIKYYSKFPSILRNLLINGHIKLPQDVLFNYDSILAYRVIIRDFSDKTPVNRNDMKSYFEENKKPRGIDCDEKRPGWYAVSLNKNIETLKNQFKLPKPNKKLAKGNVYSEGGPQQTDCDGHINWWLYEKVIFDDFVIKEDLDE